MLLLRPLENVDIIEILFLISMYIKIDTYPQSSWRGVPQCALSLNVHLLIGSIATNITLARSNIGHGGEPARAGKTSVFVPVRAGTI